MITFFIIWLSFLLAIGFIGIILIQKRVEKKEMEILNKFIKLLKFDLTNSRDYKILVINYQSNYFKKLDDYLTVNECRYTILLNSPNWLFKTKKEKWINHDVIQMKEENLLFNRNYELLIYNTEKEKITKYTNAFIGLQCTEELGNKHLKLKGKKAWI